MSQAGGAGPTRGYHYQDVAAAYFFATNKPRFINKRPLELHIEYPPKHDFSFFIRYDDYEEEHFFEVKYRSDGDFKLSQFYSTLSDFSDIANEFADPENQTCYHLVTNASFGKKLSTLFSDAKNMRRNIQSWHDIKDKVIYQAHNTSQLERNTNFSDEKSLAILIRGLYGHRLSQEHMMNELRNFIRECNGPGDVRRPAQLIVARLRKKDYGVIRREELEKAADASLTVRSDSTASTSTKSTEELIGELQGMADEFSNPSVDTQGLYENRETALKLTERMLNRDDTPEEAFESQGTSMDDDIGRLIELKEEEESLKFGLSRKANRFIDFAEEYSTDNTSEEEDL